MEQNKELRADDIFFKETKQTPKAPTAEYVAVKLSSVGKLGNPAVLHVRDYSFEEALKLADITNENEIETIVEVMNAVIFEDIDAGNLHKQDLLEIMLTILGTWYSKTIEDLPYYIDDTLTGAELTNKSNISKASIPVNNLETIPIQDLKLPITISNKTMKVQFTLPKIKNEIITKQLIETKYAEEENRLHEISKKIKDGTYTSAELKKYNNFLKRKSEDLIRFTQAQLLVSFNGEELNTLDEKVKVLSKLSISIIKKYNDAVKKYFTFGINPEVTFKCTVTKKSVTRRFNFRTLHFLSSMEQEDFNRFNISFG